MMVPSAAAFIAAMVAAAQPPGPFAEPGRGGPLSLAVDTGPWSGGYNARIAAADFDRDGDIDIVMDYALGGGARNTLWGLFLYENGGGRGADGAPAFEPPIALNHAGAPIARDRDGGGLIDLLAENALLKNTGGLNFEARPMDGPLPPRALALADWNGDGMMDALCADAGDGGVWPSASVWTRALPPYSPEGVWMGNADRRGIRLYLGNAAGDRWLDAGRLAAGGAPLETHGLHGACAADFDRDGDLDLLAGAQTELVYFQNTGTAERPALARGRSVSIGGRRGVSGLFLRPAAADWDGSGETGVLLAQEDGSVSGLRITGWDDGVPEFSDEIELLQKRPWLDAGCLATISVTDWDADGGLDIVSGNSYGEILYFENAGARAGAAMRPAVPLKAGGVPIVAKSGPNGSIQGPGEANFGYTSPVAADWNGDGRMDLIVSDAWGKYTYYQHGAGVHLEEGVPVRTADGADLDAHKPPWVWWTPGHNELVTQWRCQPAVVDWDGGGTLDLITLDAEGYLALFRGVPGPAPKVRGPERAFVWPDGSPIRVSEGVGGRSGRARIVAADWDGDGDLDLIRGCTRAGDHINPSGSAEDERAAVWMENLGDGRRFAYRGPVLSDPAVSFAGHAASPAVADWNADGRMDLLLGAEDGLVYLFAGISPN